MPKDLDLEASYSVIFKIGEPVLMGFFEFALLKGLLKFNLITKGE